MPRGSQTESLGGKRRSKELSAEPSEKRRGQLVAQKPPYIQRRILWRSVIFSSPAAPLQVPDEPLEKAKKTPERIEFEISFDGQEEESEEEQFEHNLRASMSSDAILDNSDEEDDDSDEE